MTDLFNKETPFLSMKSNQDLEEVLYQSETQFKQAFEHSLTGMALISPEGNWKRVNKSLCLIVGYSEEEIMKLNIRDITHPEDIDKSAYALENLAQLAVGELKFEKRYLHKDGHIVWVVIATTLLKDRKGKPLHYVSQIEDITARKFQENALHALNKELRDSNEQKNKLLSIIGHDLRNPISGSLQLLDLTLADFESNSADDIRHALSMMKQELSNANNLLEDLLTWAKSQFNTLIFNPVEINDIPALIEKCILNISQMAKKKHIEITTDMERGLKVWADVGMLETVFRNLLSNAIKFSDKGKKIVIGACTYKEGARFAVKDSGKGIPENKMGQLFDKHTNYTTFGTIGEKGTGFGLNICHDFVLKHGGKLWAESVEGVGSIFYFTLSNRKLTE